MGLSLDGTWGKGMTRGGVLIPLLCSWDPRYKSRLVLQGSHSLWGLSLSWLVRSLGGTRGWELERQLGADVDAAQWVVFSFPPFLNAVKKGRWRFGRTGSGERKDE